MSTHPTRTVLPLAAISTVALAFTTPTAAALVSIGEHANIYFNGSVNARYDDNVFLAEENEEEDLILIFSPGLELNVGGRGNANFNLFYREDFYRFDDLSDLNTNLTNVFLDTYYNLPRLDLRLDGTFQQLMQPEAALLVMGFDGLIERDIYRLNLRGEYEISERTSIATGASLSRVDYDLDEFFTDTDSFSVPVNLYYALTPRFDASVGYRYRFTDVDAGDFGDAREYDDHYLNLGIRGEVLPKLMGEARAGYQQRQITDEFDSEDRDLFSFGIDFSHFLTPKITLLAGLYRDFESGGQGNSIDATGGSLGARYTLTQFVSAHAGANYFERKFTDTGRQDETLDLNVGVTYSPITYVDLSAGYIFRTNDSNVPELEFDNNIFTLSAALRY